MFNWLKKIFNKFSNKKDKIVIMGTPKGINSIYLDHHKRLLDLNNYLHQKKERDIQVQKRDNKWDGYVTQCYIDNDTSTDLSIFNDNGWYDVQLYSVIEKKKNIKKEKFNKNGKRKKRTIFD